MATELVETAIFTCFLVKEEAPHASPRSGADDRCTCGTSKFDVASVTRAGASPRRVIRVMESRRLRERVGVLVNAQLGRRRARVRRVPERNDSLLYSQPQKIHVRVTDHVADLSSERRSETPLNGTCRTNYRILLQVVGFGLLRCVPVGTSRRCVPLNVKVGFGAGSDRRLFPLWSVRDLQSLSSALSDVRCCHSWIVLTSHNSLRTYAAWSCVS